jgi:Uma2 family endonuclease
MTIELETPIQLQEEQEALPTLEHGVIGSRLNRYLEAFVDEHSLGVVCTAQTDYRFVGTPPIRYPDLSFISAERLPDNLRINANFAPDLAVEIVSKGDDNYEIEEKVIQYLKSYVRLIWIVHPVSQTVQVYRLKDGLKSEILIGDEELDGEDVIPGFKLKVKKLFEFPNKKPTIVNPQ